MNEESLWDLPLFAPQADEPARSKLERAFWEFHEKHPQVYRTMVKLAKEWRARGRGYLGVAMLFERVRWETALGEESEFDFKLNNNHRAYYARLIMTNEPDLKNLFALRQQRVQASIGPKNQELTCGVHCA